MERRKALELMAAALVGVTLLPSCNFNSSLQFQNFSIDSSTLKLIEKLSYKILPIPSELVLENKSPTEFLLGMMDYTNSKADILKFTNGLSSFNTHLSNNYSSNIDSISIEELNLLMKDSTDETEQNIGFFLTKVKRYNVQYYSTLEHYLNTYTDFEFVPGRYLGCVNV